MKKREVKLADLPEPRLRVTRTEAEFKKLCTELNKAASGRDMRTRQWFEVKFPRAVVTELVAAHQRFVARWDDAPDPGQHRRRQIEKEAVEAYVEWLRDMWYEHGGLGAGAHPDPLKEYGPVGRIAAVLNTYVGAGPARAREERSEGLKPSSVKTIVRPDTKSKKPRSPLVGPPPSTEAFLRYYNEPPDDARRPAHCSDAEWARIKKLADPRNEDLSKRDRTDDERRELKWHHDLIGVNASIRRRLTKLEFMKERWRADQGRPKLRTARPFKILGQLISLIASQHQLLRSAPAPSR